MKVCDLVKMLNLTVFCGQEGLDTEITGGYTSDLLSDVMGHIEEYAYLYAMDYHANASEYTGRGYFKRRLRSIDRKRNLSG